MSAPLHFYGEHMQAERGEGHETRKRRLAKVKKGPGVFTYLGTACWVESIPTIRLTGKRKVMLDEHNVPVLDSSGRPRYRLAGEPILDEEGKPVLGGKPKIVKHPIETYELRGMKFPKGKEVVVDSPSIALKLRLLGMHFAEGEGVAINVKVEEPGKPLGTMTKAELLEVAANEGVDLPNGASKADIVEAIEAHRAELGDETDAES